MDESIGEFADTSMADPDDIEPEKSNNTGSKNILDGLKLPILPEQNKKIEEIKKSYR